MAFLVLLPGGGYLAHPGTPLKTTVQGIYTNRRHVLQLYPTG